MNMTRALPGGTRPLTLAVLVDGENIKPDLARAALDRVTEGHDTPIRRVYGCPTHARIWADGYGFHGIFTGATTGAKNTADIALVIDAMELALRNRAEGFVLVTSDSDFTRLATWLRENGYPVFGIGAAQTPERFRLACTGFHLAIAPAAVVVTAPTVPASKAIATLDSTPDPVAVAVRKPVACATMSRTLAKRLRSGGGRAQLSKIAELMIHPPGAHQIGITKYRTWRAFLEARPNVYRITGTGPETMVELVQASEA